MRKIKSKKSKSIKKVSKHKVSKTRRSTKRKTAKRKNPDYKFLFNGKETFPSGKKVKDVVEDFAVERRSVGHAGPIIKHADGVWWSVNAIQKWPNIIDIIDYRYKLRPDQLPLGIK